MAHLLAHEIYIINIGTETYHYNDSAIEVYYFYKNNADDVGAWTGKSNLALPSENTPNKYFDSVVDAFEKMREYRSLDKRYLYGMVMDFNKKILYYDHDDTNRFWINRAEKFNSFKELKKVDDWHHVPI